MIAKAVRYVKEALFRTSENTLLQIEASSLVPIKTPREMKMKKLS